MSKKPLSSYMEVVGTICFACTKPGWSCVCVLVASILPLFLHYTLRVWNCSNSVVIFPFHSPCIILSVLRDKNMSVYTLINPGQKNTNKVDMSRKCRLCET